MKSIFCISWLPAVVGLNVGGKLFTTRLTSLTSDPNSMLAAMFSGRHSLDRDSQCNFFIDRQGELFKHVLNFLRDGSLPPAALRPAVLKEAEYFQLGALVEALQGSTARLAVDKVKSTLVSYFPDYDGVKRRLVRCALEKAETSGRVWDVDVTLVLYNMGSHNTLSAPIPLTSRMEQPDVVTVHDHALRFPLSSGLSFVDFFYTISLYIASDLAEEGYTVSILQGGANLQSTSHEFQGTAAYCLTDVNFKFTLLNCPLSSIQRNQF